MAIVFFDFRPRIRSRRRAPPAGRATGLRNWCGGARRTTPLRGGVPHTPPARCLLSTQFKSPPVASLRAIYDFLPKWVPKRVLRRGFLTPLLSRSHVPTPCRHRRTQRFPHCTGPAQGPSPPRRHCTCTPPAPRPSSDFLWASMRAFHLWWDVH